MGVHDEDLTRSQEEGKAGRQRLHPTPWPALLPDVRAYSAARVDSSDMFHRGPVGPEVVPNGYQNCFSQWQDGRGHLHEASGRNATSPCFPRDAAGCWAKNRPQGSGISLWDKTSSTNLVQAPQEDPSGDGVHPDSRWHGTDLIYLGVYVDDILSAVTSDAAQEWFLNELKKRFKISHSIPAKKFVGVDIKQDLQQGTVSLSMGSYLEELFEEAGLSNCNTATTPAKPGTQLWDDPDSPLTEATPYRSRVGALLFVARHRPDIAFSVNACARFMQRPRQCHFQASTRIMRYLRGTMHTPVVFCHRLTRSGLTAYANSDWGGDRDSGRSTSACVV